MKKVTQLRAMLVAMMLTLSAVVMAQTTTVTGVLMDKTLNEAEPFATVRVFKAGKKDKPVAIRMVSSPRN